MARNERIFVLYLKKWQATVIEVSALTFNEARDTALDLYYDEVLEWGDEEVEIAEINIPESQRRRESHA